MTNRPPADPRQWRPLIFSLLALVVPFLLFLIVVLVIASGDPTPGNMVLKIFSNYGALAVLAVLQLLALNAVRRSSGWSWADVGFKRFGPRF